LKHDGALTVAGVVLGMLPLVSVSVAVGSVGAWRRGLDAFAVAGVRIVFGDSGPN